MFIAILGVIIIVIGVGLKRSPEAAGRLGGTVSTLGIVVVVIGLLLSAFKIIEPGKVGVQTLFGKVQDNVLESGLHVINPLVDVTTFDIQTQTYTMSAVSNEGQKEGDDAIGVLSADGLEVKSTFLYYIK
ncbi:MAG: prohibitin family protein [Mucilaginibacter sp.]|nr:prohibitin family protein [Mucilaginibacter sp.]